jgi:hypothetical protein
VASPPEYYVDSLKCMSIRNFVDFFEVQKDLQDVFAGIDILKRYL